ncbi:uncharacterized protein BKCO1_2300045 [Diplodia corticola]|uniref:Aga1 a-agglutinin anchor subunit n=1 Tax=Diplodia corticola TaxID=236234 RepID=A0A1J9S476_9PEZI|nr:uncharacterized protein BKCO1_2300045 [Diplodia corticola]OJD34437.1 hypothetical protein BKCO1_2300045 [Diplodia corticola]
MSFLPEPTRSPAQSSPSRLPTLSRRPTVGAADKEHGAKRRNQLPQPSASKTAATATQEDRGAGQSSQPAAPQSRPLNRTQSVGAKLAATRKTGDAARKEMPPPPVPSGVTRTRSLRRPTGGQNAASGLRAPALTGASSGAPKNAGSGSTSRPGSSSGTSSKNAALQKPGLRERTRAATVSSPQPERTRPAAASQKIQHASSSGSKIGGTALKHTRSRSDLPGGAGRTQTGIASSRSAMGSEKEPKPAAKPAFSTLQQHYSPKKTSEPKKATSAFFHASSVSTGGTDALSAEVLALQTELLQLHMLHESAADVRTQWERSAEHALRLQFYEVATAHHNMRKNESEVQELVNLHALQEWSSGNATLGLAENIQLLGPLLNELRALTDAGGRHTSAVQEFEGWSSRAEEVWMQREREQEQGRRVRVVEGLGDGWKVEVAALIRKVTALARDADRLVEPAAGSSISTVVGGCRALVTGIMHELQLMRRIEAEVGQSEAWFVEQSLQGMDAETELAQGTGAGGMVWQQV